MKQITYNELFRIDQELVALQKNNPGLSILLQSRIKSFYERNKQNFDALNNGIKAIQKKFIVHGDDGNPMMEGEGNNHDWKFVTVYTDFETASIIADRTEIKKRFEQHVAKFTSLTVNVEI